MAANITKEFETLHEELHDCEVQLWKEAQKVAIELHLSRGEILRRFCNLHNVDITPTIKLLSDSYGRAESTLWNSIKIYDTYWKGSIERSLAALPGGDEVTVRKLIGAPKKEPEPLPECNHACSKHCK